MQKTYPPITSKCLRFLHGGDYNPDQWLDRPDVLNEDMRLARLAGCNAMSIGIFSWAQLEPSEGVYTFGWLDATMDRLAANGMVAVLSTPSAAQPAWMSAAYPEILRADAEGHRNPHRGRVNFCLTAPVYREKCRTINAMLAERYKDHPALAIWHISNEYGGACTCDLCVQAFRTWLAARYGSLDALNAAWWNAFWGHTLTDWSQIGRPDRSINAMLLDWQRFVTDQTVDFMRAEIAPLRRATPAIPVTHNFMPLYPGLNYWRFVDELDVMAWDCYPQYHDRPDDIAAAVQTSLNHDILRSMKNGRPFLMMESSPSATNWNPVAKLKRPGVHRLTSLQAVAHGADSVQYFQWRAGRGAHEKFHGAVVAHDGTEQPRVFQDVADVGRTLSRLDPVLGTSSHADVAVLFDWENRWAIDNAAGPRRDGRDYVETCCNHYAAFWRRGIPVDVIDMDRDIAAYRVVVAPMLYMVRPGVAERVEAFVRAGGTFVTTYWSGIVNESDLCFEGGRPGPLRSLLGIWSEEIDVLYDDETVTVRAVGAGGDGTFEARVFCDLVRAEGAEVLAEYGSEFYAGRPALTVNRVGTGRAYYIAFRDAGTFLDAFYGRLIDEVGLARVLNVELPNGVTAQMRTDGERDFIFVLNFTHDAHTIRGVPVGIHNLETGELIDGELTLPPFGSLILERKHRARA